eukprot:6379701-Pyramimonas_sp.AAC.1
MTRGEQGASTTQDYNQWVANMQALYKHPQSGTSNQAAAPHYSAQMGHHAYANLWGGQAQAAMMTPYAASGPFYPSSVYPHGTMTYPGNGVQPSAHTGDTAAPSDPNTYQSTPADGKTADCQMGAVVEPKDEREVKRQRRKQSNRESARRSRLRKQAECEDLGSRVNSLTHENVQLRQETNSLTERVNLLISETKLLRVQVLDMGGLPAPEPFMPASTLDTS